MQVILCILFMAVPFAGYCWALATHSPSYGMWVIILSVTIIFGYPLSVVLAPLLPKPTWIERRKAERRKIEIEKLHNAINAHEPALISQISKALVRNEFGGIAKDNRGVVVSEFWFSTCIDDVNLPYEEIYAEVIAEIDRRKAKRRDAGFDADSLPSNGVDFEHWVAEGLRSFGWEARVTQGSGDQGIDVIAKRNGTVLGIQCKLYSRVVGNKAVQEAHAGKVFHNTGMAAVLSNAGFTKSAQALAATTGILLLSPHDIPTLHERLALADLDEAS